MAFLILQPLVLLNSVLPAAVVEAHPPRLPELAAMVVFAVAEAEAVAQSKTTTLREPAGMVVVVVLSLLSTSKAFHGRLR